ncbi:MAG: cupin domain-containing protein [Planctomycetes bacterium]|nr:cupin domain-containing protein [Planctomycetota bacterium]
MEIRHYTDEPAESVEEGAQGVKIRWLITENSGAKNFMMRHFEIAPGGYTPHHEHAWEHEVFILRGDGVLASIEGDKAFGPGDVIFVPAGELHQFRNPGKKPVEMLCLIPSPQRCKL